MKTAVQQVLYPKSKRYDAEFNNSISARTSRHHRSGLDERHRYDNIQIDGDTAELGDAEEEEEEEEEEVEEEVEDPEYEEAQDMGNSFEIGRAHVCTPVTNAHLVCRLLLEKKNKKSITE